MKVKIEVYGYLSDYLGKNSVDIKLKKSCKLEEILKYINVLKEHVLLAIVNNKSKPMDYKVKNKDYIKLFPPIGGG